MSCTSNFKDVIKGDSFGIKTITIQSNSTPLDLTGIEIKCEFRKGTKTGTLVKTISETDGINISDPTNGVFIVEDFLTTDFDADVYYYDFQFKYPSGKIRTYISGFFKVIQDVTQ